MRIILAGTDEGTFLTGAARIVHGQVFARDFFEVMGPGSFYWLAAFFKIFGVTFFASRISLFLTSLGTGVAMYFLTRQICSRYMVLPCILLAGTYMGVLWPGISHHVDSNFFALASVVCLVLWQRRRSRSMLIAAGALVGLTACILQPKGLLLYLACLVWLWILRGRISKFPLQVSLFTVGFFAAVLPMLGYLWSKGALGNLIYANLVWPEQNYGGTNAVVYGFSIVRNYWNPWVAAFGGGVLSIVITSILIAPLMFVVALPLSLLLVGISYRWKCIAPILLLYWLCGWALWFSEFHRKDIEHLVFGSPLLILLCIHALTESQRRFANIALQVLAISAVCLAAFNCCVVISLGAHASDTRVGRVAVTGQAEALKLLDEHLAPGEEVFVYPYCPACYFISATVNPTRYSFLQYNYNTTAQFQEVVGVLDRRRVKYVVWDTTFAARAAENFPGMQPRKPCDLIVEPYLESRYKVAEEINGIRLMERKSEPIGSLQ
jgi:4-amino-4-deoxy-L-arabinose transferase-like glycosyltransferase